MKVNEIIEWGSKVDIFQHYDLFKCFCKLLHTGRQIKDFFEGFDFDIAATFGKNPNIKVNSLFSMSKLNYFDVNIVYFLSASLIKSLNIDRENQVFVLDNLIDLATNAVCRKIISFIKDNLDNNSVVTDINNPLENLYNELSGVKSVKGLEVYSEIKSFFPEESKRFSWNSSDVDCFSTDIVEVLGLLREANEGKVTPLNICVGMVSLLKTTDFFNKPQSWNEESKEEYVNSHRVVDIYCKSGRLLFAFMVEFFNSLENVIVDEYDRLKFICENLIYGLTPTSELAIYSRLYLYDGYTIGNIMPYDLLSFDDYNKVIRKAFGEDMKFNVVVGNPPYNNDRYIDFVMAGHKLSSGYSLWITPAKWQAKEDKFNENFCNIIVPYISDIVSYRVSGTVFEGINLPGGVTYYLVGKELCKDKVINGVLVKAWDRSFGFNKNYFSIIEKVITNENFKSIIEDTNSRFYPCKSYFSSKEFGFDSTKSDFPHEDKSSEYWLESSKYIQQTRESDFKHIEDMNEYKVYFGHIINKKPLPHLVEPNHAMTRGSLLAGFGSKAECESLISYYNCKLIWFLVYNQSTGNINTSAFKHVPMPDVFDHIFTDEELYRKYNITDDEIKVIESVVNN